MLFAILYNHSENDCIRMCTYVRVYFVCIALAIHAILILGIYLNLYNAFGAYMYNFVRMYVCVYAFKYNVFHIIMYNHGMFTYLVCVWVIV